MLTEDLKSLMSPWNQAFIELQGSAEDKGHNYIGLLWIWDMQAFRSKTKVLFLGSYPL